jgi:para-aminobenzoate synthetase/4-amino-4-deoxychorismate lyase
MIVDLMRNDLGRVCEIGSVRASALLEVERHPGVWHLVSTVTGTLREGADDAALLRASFPPGSVTGTPKLRAMAATAELESLEVGPRGMYTGAVGFASPCWGAEWAVVIRSFEIGATRVELGVGGGITAESVPMREWQECLHKAAPLLAAIKTELDEDVATEVAAPSDAQLAGGLLETIACRDGVPLRLADHLARLDRSARELYRRGLPGDAVAVARAAAAAVPNGRARLRVRLRSDGALQARATPAGDAPEPTAVRLMRGRTGLWRHKWADRALIDAFDAGAGAEALFVAADGTVLETARGNVFLLHPDGTLSTPPLRDDLLPGIARRMLLDLARAEGRPVQLREFGVDELLSSAAFWTSSLSNAVPIASVDGVELPRSDALVAQFAQQLAAGHPVRAA